ncbi:MAG TPA: transglycosylase SLT domain-containing protein [Usitatibacter sp.]|nr:transglycosylase SLT domain-containing protein [Usitatibacter sp.]
MTCIKTVRWLAAAAMLALASGACAQGATDSDVLAAREAAARGNWRALEAMRARFAGHPLEAYPTYWLLAGTVERADPAEVRAFLARHGRTPLGDSLRREWLRALGASGSWEAFREEYPRWSGEDAEITCYALQERLARGDGEVAAETRQLFLLGREAPSACDPVFAAAAAGGTIQEAHVWERLRKLLGAGLVRDAKRANALLPQRQRMDEKALDRAAGDPLRYLTREKGSLSRPQREISAFAVSRLARAKPEAAAEQLALASPRLGAETAAWAWSQVAWQAALNHHPRALEWYALAGTAPLNDAQVAWKARAALRAGDWKTVLSAIQSLSPGEAREPGWRYWRARALRALGEADAAAGLMRSLAGEPHFYGLLAADELGALAAPDWNGWQPQPADLERVRAVDGIHRALILYRVGLDNEGFREWTQAIRGMPDHDLLAAAEVARLANVTDRAINTADRTVQLHDFSRRYPVPHRDALSASAREWDLDEAMMYSIIRQESRFMAEARSRVGATGLMQLMPATARWVAKQIPVQHYRPQMLVQPEVNIHMGSYYFRRVLSDLGHPILATAAYNAGPGRARRWRDDKALEGAIYAETIPFNETRDYVKKVFANAWYYRHRLGGKPSGFRELLGLVPGRAQGDAALAAHIP